MSNVRLTVRVDFGADRALGPGKIRLLEAIGKTGSISRAGRALGMSYRRAWLLIDDMNRSFRAPVVATQPGGAQGGGAALTPFGLELIENYRAIEAQATAAAKPHLQALKNSLRRQRVRPQKTRRRRSGPPPRADCASLRDVGRSGGATGGEQAVAGDRRQHQRDQHVVAGERNAEQAPRRFVAAHDVDRIQLAEDRAFGGEDR